MTSYLTFSLVAAMASHGGLAPGMRRPTESRPTRSQVLGLIAAALGIDKSDEEGLASLQTSLYVGVRVEEIGRNSRTVMTDFHTIVTPETRKGVSYYTRRDEVEAKHTKINLSYREYLQDVSYTVALWLRPGASVTLDDLAEALRRPVWTLYLGRKSCVLSLPTNPIVVDAPGLREAFETRDARAEPERTLRARLGLAGKPRWIAADVGGGFDGTRIEERRDAVMSHVRHQFGPREEAVSAW